jgi:hypothetical protein
MIAKPRTHSTAGERPFSAIRLRHQATVGQRDGIVLFPSRDLLPFKRPMSRVMF